MLNFFKWDVLDIEKTVLNGYGHKYSIKII